MKSLKILICAAFLASLVTTGMSFAESSSETVGKHCPTCTCAEKQGKPGDRVMHRLQWLGQNLNLTEEQKESLKPILKAGAEQLKALRQNETLTKEQRREQAREVNKATQAKINLVLTPEQQAKLAELRKKDKEKRAEHNA